jgi:hypothetical protein
MHSLHPPFACVQACMQSYHDDESGFVIGIQTSIGTPQQKRLLVLAHSHWECGNTYFCISAPLLAPATDHAFHEAKMCIIKGKLPP